MGNRRKATTSATLPTRAQPSDELTRLKNEIASLKDDARILRGLLEAKEQSAAHQRGLACASISCHAWLDRESHAFHLLILQPNKRGGVKRSTEVCLEFDEADIGLDYTLIENFTHTCDTPTECYLGVEYCGCEPPDAEQTTTHWIEKEDLVSLINTDDQHCGWKWQSAPLITAHWAKQERCEIVQFCRQEANANETGFVLALPFALVLPALQRVAPVADKHWTQLVEAEGYYCEECETWHYDTEDD